MINIEEIYKEYFHDIYLYILGLSSSDEIAEEVTEETFFRALKALPGFRGECEIKVWLCQIAKNEFYSYIRKNKRYILSDFSEDFPKETRDEVQKAMAVRSRQEISIEKRMVDSEQAAMIHERIHALDEPYKEVFHLRVFGELSFEQIGKLFGKTANWACVTYHRAKSRIQKEMEGL